MALWWFKKVKHISDLGQGRLESLKTELEDKTFVGEYVGHSDLVNLVKYSQEAIIFHSVVHNKVTKANAKKNAYCLADSQAILKRHFLEVTPTRICGVFDNYDALCDELVEIHKNISVKSLS